MIQLEDIEAAALRLQGVVTNTPFLPSRVLSKMTGAQVFIKFENLQFTGSFKDRGAFNKLASLDDAALKAGVCAMSAGNHAQGVAWVASRLGAHAVIVMPKATPLTKVESTRAHGAEVVSFGDTLEQAAAEAHRIARERGLTFVHPYDDPLVAAGQGTVGLEIARSGVALDAVICPLGGGGLLAGVSTAIKALRPGVGVFGVQSACYPTLARGPHPQAQGATIADGIAVKRPGDMTAQVIAARVDDVFAVEERWIEEAVALLINIEKTVAEGAGAVPLALLLRDRERFAGKRVALILSGGNIDARLLSSLLVRELVREMRLVTLRIAVADQPGFLASVAAVIADAGANIIEVHHLRTLLSHPAREAVMELTLETRGRAHADEILRRLDAAGHQAAFAD